MSVDRDVRKPTYFRQ